MNHLIHLFRSKHCTFIEEEDINIKQNKTLFLYKDREYGSAVVTFTTVI